MVRGDVEGEGLGEKSRQAREEERHDDRLGKSPQGGNHGGRSLALRLWFRLLGGLVGRLHAQGPGPRDRSPLRKTRRRHGKPESAAAQTASPPEKAGTPDAGAQGVTLVSAAAGVVALLVYIHSLCPTVVGGDSGELIVAADVFGVAHPPGYPLYTLLAGLLSRLPIGPGVAWRVNLLSALCDAGAAFLLCGAVSRWARSVWAGVLAAGLFAFSPLVWPYAVTAEVFPLNNLFAAALVSLSVAATLAPRPILLPLTAAVVGLGLTNHHTLVFFGAPVLAYGLFLERHVLSLRRVFVSSLSLAAGLLPYVYLPIAAAAHPPLLWGDPTTWSGFLAHLLRREYGTFRLANAEVGTGGQTLPRILHCLGRFATTTFWVGPALVGLSLGALRRSSRARDLLIFWLSTLAFYLVVFSTLANLRLDEPLHVTVQERFWQQAWVVGCALAGVGLAALGRIGGRGGTAVQAVVALAVTATLVTTGFRDNDLRERVLFHDYGVAVLESLPPEAILLVTSDEAIGSVRYAQQVGRVRPDVRVIPTGQLTSPWFRAFAAGQLPGVTLPPGDFTARQFVDANIGSVPILLLNRVPWLETLEASYHPWPVGLADQVLPRPREPDLGPWVKGATESFRRFDPAVAARLRVGSWETYLSEGYWKQYRRFGRAVVAAAAKQGSGATAHRAVVAALEPLVARDPRLEPEMLKNLGVAFQNLATADPEATQKMLLYWKRYLAEGPGDDPARGAIARAVEAAEGRTPSR